MKLLLLLGLFVQDVPTDDDAKEALKTFNEALKAAGSTDEQIAAATEALGCKHENVIKAVGKMLLKGTDRSKTGVALALGEVDHPESVDRLIAGLGANGRNTMVLAAIAQSLGKLGWEKGAKALHGLLKKMGDDDVRPMIADACKALGAIRSGASVDPLCNLLSSLVGGRRGARRSSWKERTAVISAANTALRAITGENEKTPQDWKNRWKEITKTQSPTVTWWNKEKQERVDLPYGEKPENKSVVVAVTYTEAPEEPKKKEGRRKKGKKKKK